MTDYVTKYTYGSSVTFPFWLVGLLFMILGFFIAGGNFKIHESARNRGRFVGIIMFLFALFWTSAVFLIQTGDKQHARNAIKEKRLNVATGVISGFDPMPESGHKLESFYVDSAYFEYSDFQIIEGFHNTKS